MKEVIITKANAPKIKTIVPSRKGTLRFRYWNWYRLPDHKFYVKYDEATLRAEACIDLTAMGLENVSLEEFIKANAYRPYNGVSERFRGILE